MRKRPLRCNALVRVLLVSAATVVYAPALAQNAPTAAADAPQAGTAGVQDIVVTANRREQNLQDVALSVSAMGAEELETFNVETGADIARFTPGVSISSSFAGQSQQYSIRGVTQNDYNDIFEGPIAVYYDDTYAPTLQGQVFGTFDLERVEILKGPQGTLFGKNATGGLIHFIPKRPTKEFEGFIDAGYGRFDEVRLEAAMSGPITPGLRARVSGLYSRNDAWLENIYPTGLAIPTPPAGPRFGEDLGKEELLAGRLQIEGDVTERLNVRLAGTIARGTSGIGPYSNHAIAPVFNAAGQHIDTIALPPGTPDGLGFVAPPPGSEQTAADFARDDGFYARSYDLSLHADYEFDGFDLIWVTSKKWFRKSLAVDVDGGPTNFVNVGLRNKVNSFSQEVRAVGETDGGLRWAGGIFFSQVKAQGALGFLAAANSLFAGVFGASATGIDLIDVARYKNTNYSGFANVDVPLGERLTLVVGGRLIHEKLRYDFASHAFANVDDYAVDTGTIIIPNLQPSHRLRESYWLWAGKINLEYRVVDGTLIYAGVSRGVKGGAFNAKLPDGTPPLPADEIFYKPETLYSYEAGLKTELLDNRLNLNAAVFYYDYKDYQAFTFENVGGTIKNNDAHAWGAELGVQLAATDRLRLNGALAYTKSTIEDVVTTSATPTAPAIINDVRPTFAPRFQASANVSWDLPIDILGGTLTAIGDVSHISDFYDNIRNFQAHRQDGRTVFNGGLTWMDSSKTLSLKAYVRNLTNETYVETSFDTATLCGCGEIAYSRPRWWMVSARKEF